MTGCRYVDGRRARHLSDLRKRPAPAPGGRPTSKPFYCNVNCYYIGHRFDPPEAEGGDDHTTTT
jgi:hypothetical protein